MTREQFMGKLIELLSDIPEAERNDSILFFESYFEEAGPLEEENVIKKLGSPEKVAAQIRANLDESNEEYAEYTEKGYEDSRQSEHDQLPDLRKQKRTNSTIILSIIALVFLAPLLKGLFGGAAGILVTILLLPFLIAFGLGVASIGMLIGGVACVAVAIPLCFTAAPIGFLTIGAGFVITAVGIISLVLLIHVAWRLLPVIVNGITNLIGRIFHRKDGAGR